MCPERSLLPLLTFEKIPFSSSNPMIDRMLNDLGKERIIVLNKSDLSNPFLQKVRGDVQELI